MTRFAMAAILVGTMGVVYVVAQAPPPEVAAGRKVFETSKCMTCHLVAGKGNKMYPLDGVAARMSEADMRLWLNDPAAMEAKLKTPPKIKMSSMKLKLAPADLEALVSYLKTLR